MVLESNALNQDVTEGDCGTNRARSGFDQHCHRPEAGRAHISEFDGVRTIRADGTPADLAGMLHYEARIAQSLARSKKGAIGILGLFAGGGPTCTTNAKILK